MIATPTPDGGMRIEAEESGDWEILRGIVRDAEGSGDLAERFGDLIGPEADGGDWREYVVPDLREGFHDELTEVGAAVEAAMFEALNGPGEIWIKASEGFAWYSALNQARLALEEKYHFGPEEKARSHSLDEEGKAAFQRSRFYCAIQGMLLEYVLV